MSFLVTKLPVELPLGPFAVLAGNTTRWQPEGQLLQCPSTARREEQPSRRARHGTARQEEGVGVGVPVMSGRFRGLPRQVGDGVCARTRVGGLGSVCV